MSPMPVKTVALIGAACVIAGWLLASMLSPPVARVQGRNEGRAAAASPADPAEPQVTPALPRLRPPAAPPPAPGRNPFVFGDRRSTVQPTTAADRQPIASPTVTAAPPPAMGPRYALSGIALTTTPDGVRRTAILSDGQTVHLVEEGDTLGAYRILEVTDTSVTIASADGVRSTFHLR